MTGNHPMFLHGTWLSGEADAALLRDLARRTATFPGSAWRLPNGRSGLVPGEGRVPGELVDPPSDRVLSLLDQVEGVPEGRARRELVDVVVGLRKVRAWAFLVDPAVARTGHRLPDGRWRSARRRA